MRFISMRLAVISMFFFMLPAMLVNATTERRTDLVIGNSNYKSGRLKNPVNDASDMVVVLENLGFSVTLEKDADLQEMKKAIENFGDSLKKGGIGLFLWRSKSI